MKHDSAERLPKKYTPTSSQLLLFCRAYSALVDRGLFGQRFRTACLPSAYNLSLLRSYSFFEMHNVFVQTLLLQPPRVRDWSGILCEQGTGSRERGAGNGEQGAVGILGAWRASKDIAESPTATAGTPKSIHNSQCIMHNYLGGETINKTVSERRYKKPDTVFIIYIGCLLTVIS